MDGIKDCSLSNCSDDKKYKHCSISITQRLCFIRIFASDGYVRLAALSAVNTDCCKGVSNMGVVVKTEICSSPLYTTRTAMHCRPRLPFYPVSSGKQLQNMTCTSLQQSIHYRHTDHTKGTDGHFIKYRWELFLHISGDVSVYVARNNALSQADDVISHSA